MVYSMLFFFIILIISNHIFRYKRRLKVKYTEKRAFREIQ